jgi:glycerol-3-phosphate acyltransferase PlsX
MPRIAIDAMGGDNAPGVVVRGTYRSATEHPDWVHILVGQEAVVHRELEPCGSPLPNIKVVNADEVIGMHEHPVEALRSKKRSSLAISVGLVKQGEADAVISAGNTGALVAGATLGLRLLPGVKRAGILTTLPTLRGRIVLMDVGANVDPKAMHLMQYAVMGDKFYRAVIGVEQDVKVGLISVGSEEGKGNALIKETHALLTQAEVDFKGNVEGHEIYEGAVQVVVCDGMTGNIVLKMSEGLAEILVKMFVGHAAKNQIKDDPRFQATIGDLMKAIDWREVGGAALLGVNGVVVIAHGRSDERAIASGIRTAAGCFDSQMNLKIIEALQLESTKAGAPQ